MNYKEAIDYLEMPKGFGAQKGLERMFKQMEMMGNPQNNLKYIHVAGSNGKGSTSAMLTSIFMEAGYKVGLFTSPHLIKYNERIKINGKNISDEDLIEGTLAVKEAAERAGELPTVFERITALGFWYFEKQKCDIVILEVGMGGIRDVTNVIEAPEAAVICHLALEHTKVLGSTIEEIAANKGGIIKTGANAVLLNQLPESEAVIKAIAEEKGCPLTITDPAQRSFVSRDLDGQVFNYKQRKNIRLRLIGSYQYDNVMVALDTIDVMQARGWNIPEEAVYSGLAKVVWPGRFQIIGREPLMIVDGAHNSDGANQLAESLRDYLPGKKFQFMMAVMASKDYDVMLKIMTPLAKSYVAVNTDSHRALDSTTLAEVITRDFGIEADDAGTVEEGIKKIIQKSSADDIIVFFGSLYQAGDVLDYFNLEA